MIQVFIDGSAGTTGLRIADRLSQRSDIQLITLSDDKRKDPSARKQALCSADLAFLCLPDEAAKEAVALAAGAKVKIIDTSTAHRTAPDWTYGFSELSPQHKARIADSFFVANPGCHASGFIAGVYPLIQSGLISPNQPLCCYSLTGYSGGGKKLIAEYEDRDRDPSHDSHRIYGLNLKHKHLPEMQKVCGLSVPPVFSPILGDFYAGMATSVLLPGMDVCAVWECLSQQYADKKLIRVLPLHAEESMLYADRLAGKDSMELIVSGHDRQTMVTAVFDNLGKGASGAAIQNMNIMMGLDETVGLVL